MFKTLRKTAAGLFAAVTIMAVPVVAPATVFAQDNIQNCLAGGTSLDVGTGAACPTADTKVGSDRINTIVKTIVNIFSAIVGIVSVIMIIFGGFKYITSGGDSGNVSAAKNTIIYAVIGLVVVALAQFIVQFVLNKVSSPGGV